MSPKRFILFSTIAAEGGGGGGGGVEAWQGFVCTDREEKGPSSPPRVFFILKRCEREAEKSLVGDGGGEMRAVKAMEEEE